MQLTVLSKENTLSMYVSSVNDLSILLQRLSPTVFDFFENCFWRTEFCEAVENVDWMSTEQFKVIRQNKSMITAGEVNQALAEEASIFDDESDVQEKKIHLKMLLVDFIFNPKKNGGRTNFGDLAKVLAKAPESVLNTELVKTLVENFYDAYFYWIFGICYIPFTIYFLSASYFFSALID